MLAPLRTSLRIAALVAVVALLTAGCGSGSDDDGGSDGGDTKDDTTAEPLTLEDITDSDDEPSEARLRESDGRQLLIDVLERAASKQVVDITIQRFDADAATAAAAIEGESDPATPPAPDERRSRTQFVYEDDSSLVEISDATSSEPQDRRCIGLNESMRRYVGGSLATTDTAWIKDEPTSGDCDPSQNYDLSDSFVIPGLTEDEAEEAFEGLADVDDEWLKVAKPTLMEVDGTQYLRLDADMPRGDEGDTESLDTGSSLVDSQIRKTGVDTLGIPFQITVGNDASIRESFLVDLETGLPVYADQFELDADESLGALKGGPRRRYAWQFPDQVEAIDFDGTPGVPAPDFPPLLTAEGEFDD